MCWDPWENSPLRMAELYVGHVGEVERGRNVAVNEWKARGFLEAIEEKYNDIDEMDIDEIEEDIEALRRIAEEDPRYLRVLEIAEKALKDRADRGEMADQS